MPTAQLFAALAVVLSFVHTAPAQARRTRDELGATFTRWFRDFRAGKIEPGDVWGPQAKPYSGHKPPAPRRRRRGPPTYSRWHEARDLFRKLAERGRAADGNRIVSVIEESLHHKGGKVWQRSGKFSRFRAVAVRAIEGTRCPTAIQERVVAKLASGLRKLAEPRVSSGLAKRDGNDVERAESARAVFAHEDPALASILIALLASYDERSNRDLLERCLQVADFDMRVAAAAALADMGFGRSIPAVARALAEARYPDDVAHLADSVARLVAADRPEPRDQDLKYALGIVIDRLQRATDWRVRKSLIPVLRRIRSRASVPVLIRLLADANRSDARPGSTTATLRSSIAAALVDLTGFYADARDPKAWDLWWTSVRDSFVLAKEAHEPKRQGGTVGSVFFGIPVTGNHVVFVLDVSGSMRWPFGGYSAAPGQPRGGTRGSRRGPQPPPGNYETRLDRARKELLKAIDGMAPDAKFGVVQFAAGVRQWKPKLVSATPANKRGLHGYAAKLRAKGGTALWGGLSLAMKFRLDRRKSQPYASHVDEIFLLSDGSPTVGEVTDTREILALVRKWNIGAQVRIHTIFLGDGRRRSRGMAGGGRGAAQFMRELARQNEGRFVQPK